MGTECGAAIADASSVTCISCDEDVATDAFGLACGVPDIEDCTTTDHALCLECAKGFFTILLVCRSCSTNTKHCSDKTTPLTCVDNAILDGECDKTDPEAEFVHNNNLLKCTSGRRVSGLKCAECDDNRVSCDALKFTTNSDAVKEGAYTTTTVDGADTFTNNGIGSCTSGSALV